MNVLPAVSAPADMLAIDPILIAIEAHKVDWAECKAVVEKTGNARFMSKAETRRKVARDLYDTRTDALVRAPITTMQGLIAFTAYLAGLRAYGCASSQYSIEVWHLSDAMDGVAEALARLAGPTHRASAH